MYEVKSPSKEELNAIDQDLLREAQKDPNGQSLSFDKLSFNIHSPYHKEVGFYKNQELVAAALVFFDENGNAPQIERFYVFSHLRGRVSLQKCLKAFVLELKSQNYTALKFYWVKNTTSHRLEKLWVRLFKSYHHEPIGAQQWLVDIN